MSERKHEVWMRGAVDGVDPWLQPVAHSLLQVKEEIETLAATVAPEEVWQRPGGAASIGFHIRHIAGALDRLYTYARGESLSPEQMTFLKAEGAEGEPLATLVPAALAGIDRGLAQVKATAVDTLPHERKVGRSGLPSTTLGLLFHGAEHALRHAGQAITTAKILRGQDQTDGVAV